MNIKLASFFLVFFSNGEAVLVGKDKKFAPVSFGLEEDHAIYINLLIFNKTEVKQLQEYF